MQCSIAACRKYEGLVRVARRKTGRADDLHESLASQTNRNWRRLNTGRLFYECFEWYNAALLAELHASDFPGVRNTHLNLLRHLDVEGTRMSDLATRSNLTKAAITSLVRACETQGLVAVQSDTEDGRARMVRFSPRGNKMMRTIQGIIASIEHRVRAHMGDAPYVIFRAALLDLSGLWDGQPHQPARPKKPDSARPAAPGAPLRRFGRSHRPKRVV